MDIHELERLTAELMSLNDNMLEKHKEAIAGKISDFYGEIEPFVKYVDHVNERWREFAVRWVERERPKYVHGVQIEQTYENVMKQALECFLTHTKERRFNETHQAIQYVLSGMMQQLSG